MPWFNPPGKTQPALLHKFYISIIFQHNRSRSHSSSVTPITLMVGERKKDGLCDSSTLLALRRSGWISRVCFRFPACQWANHPKESHAGKSSVSHNSTVRTSRSLESTRRHSSTILGSTVGAKGLKGQGCGWQELELEKRWKQLLHPELPARWKRCWSQGSGPGHMGKAVKRLIVGSSSTSLSLIKLWGET